MQIQGKILQGRTNLIFAKTIGYQYYNVAMNFRTIHQIILGSKYTLIALIASLSVYYSSMQCVVCSVAIEMIHLSILASFLLRGCHCHPLRSLQASFFFPQDYIVYCIQVKVYILIDRQVEILKKEQRLVTQQSGEIQEFLIEQHKHHYNIMHCELRNATIVITVASQYNNSLNSKHLCAKNITIYMKNCLFESIPMSKLKNHARNHADFLLKSHIFGPTCIIVKSRFMSFHYIQGPIVVLNTLQRK